MLDRLDTAAFTPGEQAAWDYALGNLSSEAPGFKITGILTAEARGHTDTDNFVTPEQFIRPINQASPLIALAAEGAIDSHLYGFAEMSIGNNIYNQAVTLYGRGPYAGSSFFGESAFSTNILMVPPGEPDDLDFNFPTRAFASVGAMNWSLQIGKDRLSWGPGESGNFLIGDHVQYHNGIRFAAFNDTLKYSFNMSSFAYPGEYFFASENAVGSIAADDPIWEPFTSALYRTTWNQQPAVEGLKLFFAHRLEWRMFEDKVNFALTEGLMYQSESGTLDPQLLNPFFLMHNLYRWQNGNSILTIEADWAFLPHFNLYAQFVMDEFAFPGVEKAPGTSDDEEPDAYGFMLGIKTAWPLEKGLLTGSFEAVYTNPYLYLRAATAGNQTLYDKGLNFIVANRYHREMFLYYYPEEFMGYRWGGDAIVFNFRADYRRLGAWDINFNAMVMIHGTHDKWTVYEYVYPIGTDGHADYLSTPTTSHETENHADPNAQTARNAAYVLTALSVSGSWNILKDLPWAKALELYGQADFVWVANQGNIQGNDAFDLQLVIGLSWKF
jgi:hypothetical protein